MSIKRCLVQTKRRSRMEAEQGAMRKRTETESIILADPIERHIKAFEKALAGLAEARKADKPYAAAAAAYAAFVEALDGAALRLGLPPSADRGIIETSEDVARRLEVDCLCSHVLSILYMGSEPSENKLPVNKAVRITSLAEEAAYNLSSIAQGGTLKDGGSNT